MGTGHHIGNESTSKYWSETCNELNDEALALGAPCRAQGKFVLTNLF